MPLSQDPEKRARQLANLDKGGTVAMERHRNPPAPPAAVAPAPPPVLPPPPSQPAESDRLAVVEYEPAHEPTAPQDTPAPPAPEPRADDAGDPEAEPEPSRGLWSELRDGFLSG